ncbi:MAG TPA: ATP-grasp domain-containing protein [Candidatus Bathyarchaeia archaeon]
MVLAKALRQRSFHRFGELNPLKLLVYEHVSGGGYAEKPIPISILSEGFSMLRTLVADFKAAGHSVSTVLNSRLAELNPPVGADYTVPVSSFRVAEQTIQKLSESVDAAYLIAPESNQMLQSLVANIEQADVPSLNCRASAIASVSDKAAMLQRVKEKGLPTPATVIVSAFDDVTRIKQSICGSLGFPLVVKPVDGVGCAGLSVVNSEQQVAGAVAKILSESASKYFMAQKLVRGIAVSVSLLATDSEALPLSLNKQDVSLMPPEANSTYTGGQVPFDSLLKSEAFAAAEAVVKSFHGLKGYVGVDLVLTEKEAVVIEVNPRLTTSYVGLRKTAGFNLAQAIINAVVEHELPANNHSLGYAVFSKVSTPKPTAVALQKTYRLNEVVSPPFPVADDDAACAVVLSHGATLKEATAGFHEAKKRLRNIIRSEGN